MAEQFDITSLNSLEDDLTTLIHSTISAIPKDITDEEYTETLRQLVDDIIAHIVKVDPIRIGASVQVPANVIHARTMALVAHAFLKDNDTEYKG